MPWMRRDRPRPPRQDEESGWIKLGEHRDTISPAELQQSATREDEFEMALAQRGTMASTRSTRR